MEIEKLNKDLKKLRDRLTKLRKKGVDVKKMRKFAELKNPERN